MRQIFDFAYSEQLMAISAILAGLLLLTGYGSKRSIWVPFALVAGLVHGYAFGETILGANLDVTAAYMAGVLGIVVAIYGGSDVGDLKSADGRRCAVDFSAHSGCRCRSDWPLLAY
jgi:hydrogenase/urease accessory protein HupE